MFGKQKETQDDLSVATTQSPDDVQTKEKPAKKKGGFVSKAKTLLVGIVIGVIIGTAGVIYLQHSNPLGKTNNLEISKASVVFDRVKSQNEMVCASQKYNITAKAKSSNKIPFTDIDIPLTGNSFWYRYVGLIKVGVNLANADFKQSGNTITVTLEQPKISSNTPNMDESTVLEENNNVLNPIHIEDVDKFKKECIKASEKESVDGGLLDEARNNAEANISGMFNAACGDTYKIEFNWK